ncbi:hypothetical protein [Azospirillum largimobile]
MAVRAFLSHATSDKPFVTKVAEYLGRAAVVFDAYEFATGDDLKAAILKGIEKSEIFILFASRESLQRDWVRFEIEEAQRSLFSQNIGQVLAFIIDPDLDFDNLPGWMKGSLITKQQSPVLVASDIRRAINSRMAESMPQHFIGRNTEFDQALDIITSFTDPEDRPPLVVFGLSGIGRKSLVEAVARDGLSLRRVHPVRLKEGDQLPEVLLKLTSSLTGDSIGNLNDFLEEAGGRPKTYLLAEIIECLRKICNGRALPIFYDEGAIVTDEGALKSDYGDLYEFIRKDSSVDLAIVSNRRISGVDGRPLPSVRVAELLPGARLRLVRLLARDRKIPISSDEAENIAEYSRGYPPAVIYAVQEMEIYGAAHVAASKADLSRFSEEIFLKRLKNDNKIKRKTQELLQLLSMYSPLPLPVMKEYCGVTSEKLANDMQHLLDFALVVPEGVNYRISEPVRQAAYRAFGGLHLDHGKVASLLEDYLSNFEDDDTRLALGQNLFRASVLAGRRSSSRFSVSLASDLIEIAIQSYHDQDYDRSIDIGDLALQARPDSVDVRRFVAQALIRKERYEDAKKHIDALMEQGHIKQAFYVRGFMARRMRKHEDAIRFYEKSLEYGRSGVPIHRELASCYFEVGELAKARAQISIAESLSPHNKFVVDLQCQIAMRIGDLPAAAKSLAVLSRVDENGFYEHRRSTYEQAIGNPSEALRYAKIAVSERKKPQFEMLANLANCQIEMDELEEAASTLSEMDNRFSQTHRDSRAGLRCKLEIKRGDIPTAEALWKKIRTPNTGVHKGLRAALLNKKAQKGLITDKENEELQGLLSFFRDNEAFRDAKLYGSEITRTD